MRGLPLLALLAVAAAGAALSGERRTAFAYEGGVPRDAEPLDRLVGRMLLVGARGDSVVPGGEFEELVCGLGVGGILLFDKEAADGAPRNVRSEEQLARLTGELQALARRCGDWPLLIAADVEGGVVNRLETLPRLSSVLRPLTLARRGPKRTYREALKIAEVMRDTGVNWNLAPVVDLNLDPDSPAIGRWGRSFSADPRVVVRHARAFIRGLRARGVLNCLKHFPGHGSSPGDPHEEQVDVSGTARPRLELAPYRALVGDGAADCVMPGHLYNARIDRARMMTFSSAAISGLLRGELGYDGLVLSDDLQMDAVLERHSLESAAVLAASAGVDMLTLTNNRGRYERALAPKVHAALLAAARDGRLPPERVAAANRRIRKLKDRLRGSLSGKPR